MTTTLDTTVTRLLEGWLSDNGLASQADVYLNELRTGNKTFYARRVAEDGPEAAEEELRQWELRYRTRDLAAGIEPVARGMLALARVDPNGEYARVASISESSTFPRCYEIHGPSQTVVVFNQQAPGCGCVQPVGSAIFSPYGELGLKAVTLQVGFRGDGQTAAQLGLVLPSRSVAFQDVSKEAYVVATISLNGYTNGHFFAPRLTADSYVWYALGLTTLDQAISCMRRSGGRFDEAVGFPGATNFLADCLPDLGEYFTDLAAKLGTDHEH